MKLRKPWMISTAAALGALALRSWLATVRYRYQPLGPNMDPHRPEMTGRYLYAFWHENILLPASQYARPDIHVLISQHADGQLITKICKRLGFSVVNGSTTRGGVKAFREMVSISETSHLAITPDGPRGPRRIVQPGVVMLAARTGLPIVTMGIAYAAAWRAKSWDRFAMPKPFSRAHLVTGELIHVPATVTPETLEPYRLWVQASLDHATAAAEAWAASNRWQAPEPLIPPPLSEPTADAA
ncbi:lysophospholipid acyltransferase family protein [Tuwongella immobilis]|uniref:DUF374 domain-containing protein n=1 Tax=Tuwongella immobilis TaxID=692036 RepID=A0A6C2YLZ6_9BACT|nr:lysophospholipid acyltransferase family protein [Tuwongella immobilis]VIP02608.1 Uncharacterized protein OS=Singulisphaera acidiphila (strain ATCC BAA-1392 / DSM 18658 / VKM B-2454 / MOB10) GN=Sinac_3150 PE=4 SV=1: DUF374 [Tuwongella immobilis]VTS01912.1 Uncharacterized protein OS=Singulisphaera acidiphila (strain ATCC BAA-1392 / DSM 18658 / VKM B-2454 / MOB10) GN=Sinac_3150 PE=4 SV=1: DUF374 [Tuwongella immobilis]